MLFTGVYVEERSADQRPLDPGPCSATHAFSRFELALQGTDRQVGFLGRLDLGWLLAEGSTQVAQITKLFVAHRFRPTLGIALATAHRAPLLRGSADKRTLAASTGR